MGYQQLFLVLMGSMLISMLMANFNNNIAQSTDILDELEIENTAVSLAQRIIEEARSKKFDANAGLPASALPDGFTPWNSLGKAGGESYPNFNDVDDFNYFNTVPRTETINGISYVITASVIYVDAAVSLESNAGDETYLKLLTVNVTSTAMSGTVTLKHVFSFFGVNPS